MPVSELPDVRSQVVRLAEDLVRPLGLELVDLVYRKQGRRWLLRLDIDRPGPGGVRLEDCETVSRDLGASLDEQDLLKESYVLEVSSPGLDRPIRTDDDVRRNTGRRVVVETDEPVDGRRRFSGVLLGRAADALRLREDKGDEVLIPRPRILKAHQEIGFR